MGCPDLINLKLMPLVSLPHTVFCLISNYQTHNIPPSPTHGSHFPPSPASRGAVTAARLAHLESAARLTWGAAREARAGLGLPAADAAVRDLLGDQMRQLEVPHDVEIVVFFSDSGNQAKFAQAGSSNVT